MSKEQMPHDKGLDHTLEVLLKEGYEYILNKRRELDTNVFDTTLLGENTICLGGVEGAELFYDNDKFKRNGAMPDRVLNTLFGQGGVQTLDGKAHEHRKQLFMPLLSDNVIHEFHAIAEEEWHTAVDKWKQMEQIVFYEEVQEILTRIITKWVGVPVEQDDYKILAADLTHMFEAAAKVGPAHHKGKKAREGREKWLVDIIKQVRNGKLDVDQDKALYQFAMHRDLDDELLSEEVAAVEVLNLLRPMVAVAVYINFTALALHDFPAQVKKVQDGGEAYKDMFAQEVRRYYPFFPFAGARVKQDFIWDGYEFKEGTLTLLDLYGTTHDESIWDDANEFNPERFNEYQENDYDLIPQGGGQHLEGHRCPGEWITIEMIKVALDFLVNKIDYELPEQDLSYSMTQMPSMPKDKMIFKNIKRKAE